VVNVVPDKVNPDNIAGTIVVPVETKRPEAGTEKLPLADEVNVVPDKVNPDNIAGTTADPVDIRTPIAGIDDTIPKVPELILKSADIAVTEPADQLLEPVELPDGPVGPCEPVGPVDPIEPDIDPPAVYKILAKMFTFC
jgi:hypothetical protein